MRIFAEVKCPNCGEDIDLVIYSTPIKDISYLECNKCNSFEILNVDVVGSWKTSGKDERFRKC